MNIYRNSSTVEYFFEVSSTQMNPFCTMHGGEITKIIDDTSGICCHQWCDDRVTTAAFHDVSMFIPLYTGDLLKVIATIIYAGKTSMTTVAYVIRENPETKPVLAAQAYATFVHLTDEHTKGDVPPLPIDTAKAQEMADLALQIRHFSKSLAKVRANIL